MKCLCASKNCRGVIGGTQEGKELSTAARAAALEAAIEVPEGQQDPDFIMVTGGCCCRRCWGLEAAAACFCY